MSTRSAPDDWPNGGRFHKPRPKRDDEDNEDTESGGFSETDVWFHNEGNIAFLELDEDARNTLASGATIRVHWSAPGESQNPLQAITEPVTTAKAAGLTPTGAEDYSSDQGSNQDMSAIEPSIEGAKQEVWEPIFSAVSLTGAVFSGLLVLLFLVAGGIPLAVVAAICMGFFIYSYYHGLE